ncbi:hypothetical protein KTD17_05880 [Burkholderia multivorans]|uniref:hypothetical protein n=1 Tax=Burkholderia multivorans TaxID=87883 RepID=UPI001C24A41B|nr:hypothetical protein [Burkholderia multivorans]MBU9132528.1 hypothetical protein [Burkholderia multivorans]
MRLANGRPDSILVSVTVVGQRVEIDVFDDGHMEVSRFEGNEDIEGGVELIDSIVASARSRYEADADKTAGNKKRTLARPFAV